MQFTLDFLKVFLNGIWLTLPLLSSFTVTVAVLGLIVGRIEKWTPFNAIYWSFITASTVGYGDIRPSKKRSKALAIAIALIGLMFTGIIVAITVASATHAFEVNVGMEALTPSDDP
ncbi:potassium channel family protein [Marinobacter sp. chi1]|uniref:Potassium channel family protein n=2 Tax=Marinobacter TaxID=2742 RepID=A0ABT8W3K8_9GAMM|nr:potassium channel family protein [Marinobacter sp. chi1]MBZ2167452.1 potassium channel family protein [Marinobacter sp. F4216]MDO3722817.1 potassium channel family protein [Marinobacter sp. chi1]